MRRKFIEMANSQMNQEGSSGGFTKQQVASGVDQLDRLLGGLFIGDNVVWHDDAGSLASVFCLNFLQASEANNKPIIYVSFDRSPRNLLERLGHLAEYPNLTILDCSAIACIMDWRIHHTAYEINLKPRVSSNRWAALISPRFPSLMRSGRLNPWF